jgi:hypothetical protein
LELAIQRWTLKNRLGNVHWTLHFVAVPGFARWQFIRNNASQSWCYRHNNLQAYHLPVLQTANTIATQATSSHELTCRSQGSDCAGSTSAVSSQHAAMQRRTSRSQASYHRQATFGTQRHDSVNANCRTFKHLPLLECAVSARVLLTLATKCGLEPRLCLVLFLGFCLQSRT